MQTTVLKIDLIFLIFWKLINKHGSRGTVSLEEKKLKMQKN